MSTVTATSQKKSEPRISSGVVGFRVDRGQIFYFSWTRSADIPRASEIRPTVRNRNPMGGMPRVFGDAIGTQKVITMLPSRK